MKEVSLDIPTLTQFALGDLPENEAKLLKFTHAAPGAAMAMQDEVEAIRSVGNLLRTSYAAAETVDHGQFVLTGDQRERILKMAATPHAANGPVKRTSLGQDKLVASERAIAWRAGFWTLGAAAAVIALLFFVQSPEDKSGKGGVTAEDTPQDITTGKFKIRKPTESPKIYDSGKLAQKMPQQLPGQQEKGTVLPEAPGPVETPSANLATDKSAPKLPSMKNAIPEQRGPIPVSPGANGAENKAFAAPKP